jgi:hypothetical protein
VRTYAAVNEIVSPDGTSTELGVGNQDTSVDNVDTASAAGSGVIDVAGVAGGLVGDGSKTPWGTSLGGQGACTHDAIELNVINLHGVSYGRGSIHVISEHTFGSAAISATVASSASSSNPLNPSMS